MKRAPLPLRMGRAIRQHREAIGISQEAVADKLGMHRTYYSQVERGKKDIRIGTLEKICDALGVSMSDVVRNAER